MSLEIKFDAAEFEREMKSAAQEIAARVETALDRGAQIMLEAKLREAQATYARPVRRLKSGKPAWTRSGDLLAGQTIESAPGQRKVLTTGPGAQYEERLANLPTGPDGISRRNPMAENALLKSENQALAAIEQELLSGF